MAIIWAQGCKIIQRKMRQSRNLIEMKRKQSTAGLFQHSNKSWEGQF